MADYDFKLGEFYKDVQKRAAELAARKAAKSAPQDRPEPVAEVQQPQPDARDERRVEMDRRPPAVEASTPVREASVSTIPRVDVRTREVLAGASDGSSEGTGTPRPAGASEAGAARGTAASLFEDADAPQVEDFLSFLDRSRDQRGRAETVDPVLADVPEDQGTLAFSSEGTGEPRPIPPKWQREQAVVEMPQVQAKVEAPGRPAVEPVAKPVEAAVLAPEPMAQASIEPLSVQEKWDRLPHHLQTLFEVPSEEVAQNSYRKTFKESRTTLIQRLLDPQISLEEAARILNVCPTTVRRYTNKGVLKHYRTAGNQRRFRLSDVLGFMENGQRGLKSSAPAESDEG